MASFNNDAPINAWLKGLNDSVLQLETTVAASGARIVAGMKATQAEVEERGRQIVATAEEQTRRAEDVIDRLMSGLTTNGTDVEEWYLRMLQTLNAGAISVQDFLKTWGDAVVQIDGDLKTFREAFRGIDFRSRTQEIQDLMLAIRESAQGIDQALAFLTQSQFEVAKRLADTIALFRQGKKSFEDVVRLVDAIKKLFAGTDFADLAGALEQALRQGEFDKLKNR
jgi:hypothetical protein